MQTNRSKDECIIFSDAIKTKHIVSLSNTLMELAHETKLFEHCHEKTCFIRYANNKGADQPAHLCSLISAFVVRRLDSVVSILAISIISRLELLSKAEQAGLSLTWSKTPADRLCPDAHLKANKAGLQPCAYAV